MIKLIAYPSKMPVYYDLSKRATSISWETNVGESAGKITFNYMDDGQTRLEEGSKVVLYNDSKIIAIGYVFERNISGGGEISITAYDQLRYLQNKDAKVIQRMSCSDLFAIICAEQGLKHKVIHKSNYTLAPRVESDKSYFEMLTNAFDATLTNTGAWFYIRDNAGVIEHVSLDSQRTGLAIGSKSLMTNFSYKSSIDDSTANQIKLVRDNKQTKKREIYMVYDSANMAKWGTLRHFAIMDENANPAQVAAKANQLLELLNRPKRSLKLSCRGDLRIREGAGIFINIDVLKAENIENKGNQYIVMSCKHDFANDDHTMELEVLML